MSIVYTIFCKSEDSNEIQKFNLLKKAFKNKYLAYEYTTLKITKMLDDIHNEYLTGKYNKHRILPIHSVTIYSLYKYKTNIEDKYNYFLSKYKEFFHGVNFPVTMFFISEHTLI